MLGRRIRSGCGGGSFARHLVGTTLSFFNGRWMHCWNFSVVWWKRVDHIPRVRVKILEKCAQARRLAAMPLLSTAAFSRGTYLCPWSRFTNFEHARSTKKSAMNSRILFILVIGTFHFFFVLSHNNSIESTKNVLHIRPSNQVRAGSQNPATPDVCLYELIWAHLLRKTLSLTLLL